MTGLAQRANTRIQRRRERRVPIGLVGRFYLPGVGAEHVCDVLDFSPDGAGIKCEAPASVGAAIVLYLEGFGRFEGVVVRSAGPQLGIEFKSSDAKRARTARQIEGFLVGGATGAASASRPKAALTRQFVASDGTAADCEIIGIALGSASLRTDVRPELGSHIRFGMSTGCVIRHTRVGVDVEFVEIPPMPGAVAMR